MAAWAKEEIELQGGAKALAQMPVIVSASRSTDVPAFYAGWFMERLKAGYVKWFNPFNGVPLYVGFKKMRCIVFWSKNPAPMISHLDELDKICPNYYFQFTLNDYDAEGIEPRVPPIAERVETFKRLSERVGKDRVIWRFDPLILTDKLEVNNILEKVERLGDKIAAYTSRFVFSFIDIKSYAKVNKNLERGGIAAREFSSDEMCEVAQRIGELVKDWGIAAGTCGETADLDRYGIEHNRCVDDRLMVKCFSHDKCLMDFLAGGNSVGRSPRDRRGLHVAPSLPFFGSAVSISSQYTKLKDPGQRLACGCIMSKDIGEYNTCPHLCHYCYANSNNATALANWKRHRECPHAETIAG